jgi:hypothetical protein
VAPSEENQAWRAKSKPPGEIGSGGGWSVARSETASPIVALAPSLAAA